MTVHYNNAKIVTDGLVTYYDSANTKSYVSGSNIINDISGNNMYAGPRGSLFYTASYGGGFRFRTVSSGELLAQSSSFTIGSGGCTMALWVVHESILTGAGYMRYISVLDSSPSVDDLIIRHRYSATSTPNGALEMVVKTSGTYRLFNIDNQIQTNIPTYITATWNGTTMNVYKNAVSVGTNTPGGTYTATSKFVQVSSNTAETMNGQMYCIAVYNRALSPLEIRQNFDASRWRFGI